MIRPPSKLPQAVDVLTNRVMVRYNPKNIMFKVLIGRIHAFG